MIAALEGLPLNYEFEVHSGFPGDGGEIHYFPNERAVGSGLTVRFKTQAASWTGFFYEGLLGGITGIGPWVLPAKALVVCRGATYLVDAANPRVFEMLEPDSVFSIAVASDASLVVLGDHSRAVAYSSQGLAWRTARIAHDWLEILSVDSEYVRCRGAFPPDMDDRDFRLDRKTGRPIEDFAIREGEWSQPGAG